MKTAYFFLLGLLSLLTACTAGETLPESAETLLRNSVDECQSTTLFICTIQAWQKGSDPKGVIPSMASNGSLTKVDDYDEVWCINLRNRENSAEYPVLYYRRQPSFFSWLNTIDDLLVYPVNNADLTTVGCRQLAEQIASLSSPLSTPTQLPLIDQIAAIRLAKTYLDGAADKTGVTLLGAASLSYLESLERLNRIALTDLSQADAETPVWVVGFQNDQGFLGSDYTRVYVTLHAQSGSHITNYFASTNELNEIFSR